MISGTKTWRDVALGDVCELKYGKSLPEASRLPGNVLVYGSNGVVGAHDNAYTDGPTIVVGRKGSVGEINYSPASCWPIDTTYFIDASSTETDLKWLAYRLRGLGLTRLNKAAAVPGLNRDDAYRQRLLLPPLAEQRRIAAILDAAESLRAKRRATLAKLDSLTQSIFLDMFGDPTHKGRRWARERLEDIAVKITDGEHLNPVFSSDGMPIVMAGNVLEDKVDLVSTKRVARSLGESFRRKCCPEKGDLLLVSRGATIGRLCVVNCDTAFCLMGSVILLKLDDRQVNSEYLKHALKQPSMRSKLVHTSGSSAQQAIYLKDLKSLECNIPPIDAQSEFARQVIRIEAVQRQIESSILQMNILFSSLQHRAFRGEL